MGIFKKLDKTENREVYYIDFYDENGKRIRESTGSSSRTFANELLTNRKDEVAKRKKLPDRYIPHILLSDFVDNEYVPIHVKGSKGEPNTKGICEKLKTHFEGKHLHEITSRDVEMYKQILQQGGSAGNTINNRINTLSGIFTKAIDWGKAFLNPVHKVKRFRITERKRILERWELDALIIVAGKEKKAPHLLPLIIFDLMTGLRKEELLSIKWTDVDFENVQLLVRAEIAKYNKSRYVDCEFRTISTSHSGGTRPAVSDHRDHLFRSDCDHFWIISERGGRDSETSSQTCLGERMSDAG